MICIKNDGFCDMFVRLNGVFSSDRVEYFVIDKVNCVVFLGDVFLGFRDCWMRFY